MLIRLSGRSGQFDIVPQGFSISDGTRMPFHDASAASQFLNQFRHDPQAMERLLALHQYVNKGLSGRMISHEVAISNLAQGVSKGTLSVVRLDEASVSQQHSAGIAGLSIAADPKPLPMTSYERQQWEEEFDAVEEPEKKYKIVVEIAGTNLSGHTLAGHLEISRSPDGDPSERTVFNDVGNDAHRVQVNFEDVPNKPRRLFYVLGSCRLPLCLDAAAVEEDAEAQQWPTVLVPVIPVNDNREETQSQDLVPLPRGWLYVYVNGYLWRELQIYNDAGVLRDVNLGKNPAKDKRVADGQMINTVLLPYKLAGAVQTVQLAYSHKQWSWEQLCKAGGLDAEDPRFLESVKQKAASISVDSQFQDRYLRPIDLSAYEQEFAASSESDSESIALHAVSAAPEVILDLQSPVDLLKKFRDCNIAAASLKIPERLKLTSLYAHEQLQQLATELSEAAFMVLLNPIFGSDVPIEAYSALYRNLSDNAVAAPAIKVHGSRIKGHLAAYSSEDRKIHLTEELIDAAIEDEENRPKLFAALMEEYGHYIDDLLRNEYSTVGGDAVNDEGARYAYQLSYFDIAKTNELEIAEVESEDYSGPLVIDLSEAQAAIEAYAGEQEQQSDGKAGSYEFFGAGRGNVNNPGSYGHQSIEEILTTVGFDRDKDLHRVYFGNWLRDFSQIVDPAVVRPADELLAQAQQARKKKKEDSQAPAQDSLRLSRQALTKLVGVMAWKEFAKENVAFSLEAQELLMGEQGMEILGGYRPEEHIDNPLPPGKPQDWEDASLVDPVFAKPPTLLQLDLNPATGLKNYIATSTPAQSFPTAVDYMAGRFKLAMQAGYTTEGLRYFGEGLHVLEDFFSHSNFVEVSLIKLGFTKVVPWTEIPASMQRIPIVTGCFGRSDVLASVGPKIAELIPHEIEPYEAIKPGERTPTDLTILIVLEDLAKAQQADSTQSNTNYLGLNYAEMLEDYNTYLKLRDKVNEGKADWRVRWFFKSMHYSMQAFLVVTSYTTYLIGHNASHSIDDLQTALSDGMGTNPTHSQLAKDHDVHHFHELAAKLAEFAVGEVGKLMRRYYAGDLQADPIAMAKSFIVHPQDTNWMDGMVMKWATSHPENMKRGESKTEYEHVHKEVKVQLKQMDEATKGWRFKLNRKINEWFNGQAPQ